MKGNELERLLSGYQAGTRHPEVSGMEHLNLLQIRSRLAESDSELTEAQRKQLKKADQELFLRAHEFLRAIRQIADLDSWRAQENCPATHWWWYLDVITHLPVTVGQTTGQKQRREVTFA